MESVPSRKDRKTSIRHDRDIPNILDSRSGILSVHGKYLGIDCSKKTVPLRTSGHAEEKTPCGKTIMESCMDARPRFMISHSGSSQLGSALQDFKRSRSKLACRMVTAMN